MKTNVSTVEREVRVSSLIFTIFILSIGYIGGDTFGRGAVFAVLSMWIYHTLFGLDKLVTKKEGN